MRFILLFLFSIGSALVTQGQSQQEIQSWQQRAKNITIIRDRWGVPHIYGKTDADCTFGFAYTQAEDNFEQIEDNYIRASGRAAEEHGEAEYSKDLTVHALELPFYSQQEYGNSSKRMQQLLDAYADGLNYYLWKTGTKTKLLTKMEPWYPIAMLRYKYYVMEFLGYAGLNASNAAIEKMSDPNYLPTGSNAWAVSPQKTVSGNTMLLINPHVSFFGFGTFLEGHLISEEGWNFSGLTRHGFPFPYMGHNEHLGWGYTDNYSDIGDLYIETFDNPAKPLSYRYGNSYREAQQWSVNIKVNNKGTLEEKKAVFRKTHHGPLMAEASRSPVAIKLSKYIEGGWMEQWYNMTKAANWKEFKEAIAPLNVPYMNTTYADDAGNIFYVYTSAVPKRNVKYKYDLMLDGSNPETEWNGYHTLEELPQLFNPTEGYVQNCNSSPLHTTHQVMASTKFPAYMLGSEINNVRARRSKQILMTSEKFTFDSWSSLALDTKAMLAEEVLPGLIPKLTKSLDESKAGVPYIEALTELKSWNYQSSINSVPMTLFSQWHWKIRGGEKDSVRAFVSAIDDLQTKFNNWRVPYGDINRLQRVHWSGSELFSDQKSSFPVPGGTSLMGTIFCFNAFGRDQIRAVEKTSVKNYGVQGNSYVSTVEFGKKLKARSILFFGQSSNPSSPHYLDQAKLYAEAKFKEAYFYKEDIVKNAERTYRPGE